MPVRRRPASTRFGRVAIVGVGLVGGSIGLALKARGLASHVSGVTLDAEAVRAALRSRAIDSGTTDLETGLAGASVAILATGVDSLPRLARRVLDGVGARTLVTDVGSVKRPITRAAGADPRFVPGHPMAGSEKSGVEHASADLFQDSLAVLTPSSAAPWALARATRLWRSLGARVVRLDARDHDERVAAASHVPYVAAAALSLSLSLTKGAARLAARGFRDTTRVAASDPDLWAGILLANAAAVRRSLRALRESLDRIGSALRDDDPRRLRTLLERAARARSRVASADPRTTPK